MDMEKQDTGVTKGSPESGGLPRQGCLLTAASAFLPSWEAVYGSRLGRFFIIVVLIGLGIAGVWKLIPTNIQSNLIYWAFQPSFKRQFFFVVGEPFCSEKYHNPSLFMNWQKVAGAETYDLFDNGKFAKGDIWKQSERTVFTYNDSLKPGVHYFFVRATNAIGNTVDSNITSVTIPADLCAQFKDLPSTRTLAGTDKTG